MADETIKPMPKDNLIPLSVEAVPRDAEAFAGLYDQFVRAIYRYIYLRVGNDAEAEDLTEQVFLRAWRAWPRYRDQTGSPAAWLFRIAHNLVVDHHRAQRVESSLDDELGLTSGDDPAETVSRRAGQARLVAAIRQLRPDQQQVVVLRFVEGLGYPEVAAILGKSEGAVRVIQHRALVTLRAILTSD